MRDHNARAAAAHAKKQEERTKRFDELETELIGLTDEILDSTFPQDDNSNPVWDKFNWNKAEELKRVLQQFQQNATQATATTSQPADQSTTRQQPRVQRQQTQPLAVAPDTAPAATPPASTSSTPAPPKSVWSFAKKVWSGN